MINTPDTYTKAGERCAEARHVRDEANASEINRWFQRACALEQPEDRSTARLLFDSAYRNTMLDYRS